MYYEINSLKFYDFLLIYLSLSLFFFYLMNWKVTSPGGTTAAGIYQLEKGGFRTVIADAVWAAYKRSKELGSN